MTLEEAKKRYEEIQPFIPMNNPCISWIDKVATWDDFIKNGRLTADLCREVTARNYPTNTNLVDEECPELFNLLMEFYPAE